MNDNNKNIGDLLNSPSEAGVVYFIGIGGIGMSALARYFHSARVDRVLFYVAQTGPNAHGSLPTNI